MGNLGVFAPNIKRQSANLQAFLKETKIGAEGNKNGVKKNVKDWGKFRGGRLHEKWEEVVRFSKFQQIWNP